MAKNKKILQEEAKKEYIKQKKELIPLLQKGVTKKEEKHPYILDRFLPKPKVKKP